MKAKKDDKRWIIPLALVAVFLVVVAIKGIGEFRAEPSSQFEIKDVKPAQSAPLDQDAGEPRGGSIYHLLHNHPDPRISQDLFRAWEAGEVWVMSRDLSPMGGVQLERMTAQAVFEQYGKRAASNDQKIFTIDAEKLKESRVNRDVALELETMLLLSYEASLLPVILPAEQPAVAKDTAVQ